MNKKFQICILKALIFVFLIYSSEAVIDSTNKTPKEPNYYSIKELSNKISPVQANGKIKNKWLKRWLWNNRNDINSEGKIIETNPKEYIKSYSETRTKEHGILSDNGWVPVGPLDIPPTYEPVSCYGLGRINCIAFHPSDSNMFWLGTPGGGVWKTENGGKSWTPLTDNLSSLAVSDIAVDPTNPDIIYIATGDYDGGGMSSSNAIGVCKSTDGGLTWERTSLYQDSKFRSSLLRRIIINPNNPNELIASGTRGIWKSYDGGGTWLIINDTLLVTAMEIHPQNPQVLIGATGKVWNYYGSAGIIKSTDFGETWQILNSGITEYSGVSRIDISISPADPNYIYAVCVSNDGSTYNGLQGVYLSTDSGENWELKADQTTSSNILGAWEGNSTDLSGQGTYDLVILADPFDREKAYVGGVNLWMTENSGEDWEIAGFWVYCFGKSIHADHHNAAFNPLNKSFYWCNDGGIYKTKEILPGSKQWISDWIDRYEENAKPGHPDYKFPTVWEVLTNGLSITEFYRLSLCKNYSGVVAGGSQDNSCFYHNQGSWVNYIANYDGMETMIAHNNPQVIYGVWQNGGLCKSTDGGKTIKKRLTDSIKTKLGEDGLWITPVSMDPINSDIIYAGFRNLYKSTNGGDFWVKIFNSDSIASITYNDNNISIVKNSHSNSDYLAVYKDKISYNGIAGELWLTTDGAKTWNLCNSGLPVDTLNIVGIDFDYNNPQKIWVAIYSGYYEINTYLTEDAGKTWTDISKTMPNGILIRSFVHQPSPHNTLYVGTNHGVYYTDDTQTQWLRYSENLPNAIINDLEIDNTTNELYAATYGRGIWKTNLLPVGVKEDSVENKDFKIYPNPTQGDFTIELSLPNSTANDNINMTINDIVGKKVYEQTLTLNGNMLKQEVKTTLENGIYFVELDYKGRLYSGKLIITK